MTTLIAVYDGTGACIGRCDEKCYGAIEEKCTCICGGMNHGVGISRALTNNLEFVLAHPESRVDDGGPVQYEMILPLSL